MSGKVETDWIEVLNAARNTVSKKGLDKEPSAKWKKQMLLAEHSPIRLLAFTHKWVGLKYWISVHFTRHKHGIEHFVSTQRDDRTGKARGDQDAPVDHRIDLNAQAAINISRKRLCSKTHKETRKAWWEVVKTLDPSVQEVCVPECVYRGFCPEMKSCGFAETEIYFDKLNEYRKI